MKVVKGNFGTDRRLYLAASTLFLFFLIYSTPHRVHHLFDPNPETSCATFTLSKGCHLKPTPAVNLPITKIATEGIILSLGVWTPYLIPSPFSKRAPPLV